MILDDLLVPKKPTTFKDAWRGDQLSLGGGVIIININI